MAITKLLSPNTPNPITAGGGGDWDLAMAQLTAVKKLLAGEQMMLTEWTNNTTQPKLALGTHLQHKGAIYVVDTEDYALPALGGNGTYYIVLDTSGETLVGSWVTSLSGFAWDATYNGLYDGDALALPYQVVVDGAVVSKRKILNPWSLSGFTTVDYLGNVHGVMDIAASGSITAGGNITAIGKLTGATINTGSGDNKVYRVSIDKKENFANTTDQYTYTTADMQVHEIRALCFRGYTEAEKVLKIVLPNNGRYLMLTASMTGLSSFIDWLPISIGGNYPDNILHIGLYEGGDDIYHNVYSARSYFILRGFVMRVE